MLSGQRAICAGRRSSPPARKGTPTARLLVERGADITAKTSFGNTPRFYAQANGFLALAAWLKRIQAHGGWTRYLSLPRYKLVLLRELVARGRARRERALFGKERVLDLLFPGDQTNQPQLPNSVFPLVVRYYWGRDFDYQADYLGTYP